MQIADLDRICSQNNWLIAKRAGAAGVKAVSLGSGNLAALIEEIADSYGLDEDDRQLLRPTISIDAHQGLAKAAEFAVNAPTVANGVKIARDAHAAGKMLPTARAFATKGMKAAQAVTKSGGKAAKAAKAASQLGFFGKWGAAIGSKATPIGLVLTGAYVLGTSGFFAAKGRRYNLDCHALLKDRLMPEAIAVPESSADGNPVAHIMPVEIAPS